MPARNEGLEQLELLRKMGTPSRLGVHIGLEFMGAVYSIYPWIIEVERRLLDAINDPEPRFLIINLPPQTGKTSLAVLTMAWFLGMNPFSQVIFVAYSEEYAASAGYKVRELLKRWGMELFGDTVSSGADSKSNWKMTNGFGGMLSVGIGGGITGNPGHLIWIDDVIKTMEEAGSVTAKAKHLAEFDGAISTRLQPNSTVVISATRFADDDLTGALVARQNEPDYEGYRFEVISIPAFAEPPDDIELPEEELAKWVDFLGRHHGEPLECRYNPKFFEMRRASLRAGFEWSALYQQMPSLREGGMFPKGKWKWWSEAQPPHIVRAVRAWDLATTENDGDWTVGTKMGLASTGDLYLLDVERFRRSTGQVEKAVLDTARADGFGVKIIIEQEKAGAGKALVEHYQRILPGYVVESGKVEGSKEQRATPYSSMQDQGRVWLPQAPHLADKMKTWVENHRKMMGDGRRPRHDDEIDTAAYCVLDLLANGATDMFVPGVDQMRDIDAFRGAENWIMGRNPFSAVA